MQSVKPWHTLTSESVPLSLKETACQVQTCENAQVRVYHLRPPRTFTIPQDAVILEKLQNYHISCGE